jgi:propane monooxygenase reductase subunit
MILVGAGSGMSPVWSILNDHLNSGEQRPVYFFYGARTQQDLFYLDRIAALVGKHPDLNFIPVLSHVNGDASWDGERGFVHERVDAKLKELAVDGQGDVYACGPPPMIDALQPVLFMNGFENERIFFDRFTTSSAGSAGH